MRKNEFIFENWNGFAERVSFNIKVMENAVASFLKGTLTILSTTLKEYTVKFAYLGPAQNKFYNRMNLMSKV